MAPPRCDAAPTRCEETSARPIATTLTELRDLYPTVKQHDAALAAVNYGAARRDLFRDSIRLVDTAVFADVNSTGTMDEEVEDLRTLVSEAKLHRDRLIEVGATEDSLNQGGSLLRAAESRDLLGVLGIRNQEEALGLRNAILTYAIQLGREARAAGVNGCYERAEARRRFEASSFKDGTEFGDGSGAFRGGAILARVPGPAFPREGADWQEAARADTDVSTEMLSVPRLTVVGQCESMRVLANGGRAAGHSGGVGVMPSSSRYAAWLVLGLLFAACVPPGSSGEGMVEDPASSPGGAITSATSSASSIERRCGVSLDAMKRSESPDPGDRKALLTKCEAGEQQKCVMLGESLTADEGTDQDPLRAAGSLRSAAKLFEAACSAGHAPGCTWLGRMMQHRRANALQVAVLRSSPHAPGRTNLSALFKGDEPRGSDGGASAFYKKACDAGDAAGCVALGNVAKNIDEHTARDLYDKACKAGNANGCYELATLLALSRGALQDWPRALHVMKRACEEGDVNACGLMGRSLRSKDTWCEAALYAATCGKGSSVSCAVLGEMFEQGRGVSADQGRADTFFIKACNSGAPLSCAKLFGRLCDAGVAQGCGALGDLELSRMPVTRDFLSQNEEQKRGVSRLGKACDGGDTQACMRLGVTLMIGFSSIIQKDETRAATLFTKACDQGINRGCTLLGTMLEDGRGVDKDEARAFSAYTRACGTGDPRACFNMGKMLEEGRGVAKNEARAAILHTKGCDAGEPGACFHLANMLAEGRGVAKNEARAAGAHARACAMGHQGSCNRFSAETVAIGGQQVAGAAVPFTRACDGGDTPACAGFGVLFALGHGVGKDEDRAVALFTKACEGGDASACTILGMTFALGHGVDKDEARAAALFTKACDAGVAEGCFFMGNLLEDGRGVSKDEARAAAHYTRACDGRYAVGCYNLGKLLAEGRGAGKDEARAAAFFTKACDGGEPEGCVALGHLFKDGRGVHKDEARAAALFTNVCSRGHAASCVALGKVYERMRDAGREAAAASK